MGPGGGYIFSSDHSVPSSVSLENFRAITDLAKELRNDLLDIPKISKVELQVLMQEHLKISHLMNLAMWKT